jgi:two-component system NtrC family response regulator
MPDGSGLDLVPEIRASAAAPEVIIITASGTPTGRAGHQEGAWDYIEKPLSVKSVMLCVERALQCRDKARRFQPVALKVEGIVGRAPRSGPVSTPWPRRPPATPMSSSPGNGHRQGSCLLGHSQEQRPVERNFVVVDCAALPETLVESTLFGHVRGAFTGADKPRDGLVRQADGGSLFLDEIGELSISIQKAFLRVLQEKRFRPVGGGQEVTSDFRLVAATNRRLEDLTRTGGFREDLLFRLRTLVLELPPLREMKEDIKDLMQHYIVRFCEQYGSPVKGYSPDFLEVLLAYDWPGNVRELIKALEKAIISAKDEPVLFPQHLPDHIRIDLVRAAVIQKRPPRPNGASRRQPVSTSRFPDAERQDRKDYLASLLRRTNGDAESLDLGLPARASIRS